MGQITLRTADQALSDLNFFELQPSVVPDIKSAGEELLDLMLQN